MIYNYYLGTIRKNPFCCDPRADDISSHEYKMLTDKQTKQEAIEQRNKRSMVVQDVPPTVPGRLNISKTQ
jgi:hypothetical protein